VSSLRGNSPLPVSNYVSRVYNISFSISTSVPLVPERGCVYAIFPLLVIQSFHVCGRENDLPVPLFLSFLIRSYLVQLGRIEGTYCYVYKWHHVSASARKRRPFGPRHGGESTQTTGGIVAFNARKLIMLESQRHKLRYWLVSLLKQRVLRRIAYQSSPRRTSLSKVY
jgi:hypothetical protein